jgi:twitching motility protein PilI
MSKDYFRVNLSDSFALGLPLTEVETVIKLEQREIAAIPGIAQFWYGVTNYRGSLLWVLDTGDFLQLDDWQINPLEKLTAVVLNYQFQGIKRRVAVTVQQLAGVVSPQDKQLQPLSSENQAKFRDLFTSQVQSDELPIYLLDIEKLLQDLYQKSELLKV